MRKVAFCMEVLLIFLSFTGALIYLLDMFCNSTHPQVRSQTAELFAKMTADKLIGPKVSTRYQLLGNYFITFDFMSVWDGEDRKCFSVEAGVVALCQGSLC